MEPDRAVLDSTVEVHGHRVNKHRLVRGAVALIATLGIARAAEPVDLMADMVEARIEHAVPDIGEAAPQPDSIEYIEDEFGVGNGLFLDTTYGNYTTIWPHSRVLAALQTASQLPGAPASYREKFLNSLEAANVYWEDGTDDELAGYYAGVHKLGVANSSDRYVDDNLWMGRILIQEYRQSGDERWLKRAQDIYELALSQWDETKGGIFWQVQGDGVTDHTKSLVSNAPAVQLGIELYHITGDQKYLDTSKAIFSWVKRSLYDHRLGLYNDNIDTNHSVNDTKWSYGQGTLAGAMAALSTVDPEHYPLSDAVHLIKTSLKSIEREWLPGNPTFHAIFYENAQIIAAMSGNASFTADVHRSHEASVDELPDKPADDLLAAASRVQLRLLLKQSVSTNSKPRR